MADMFPGNTLDFSRGFSGRLIVAMPHLADTPFEKAVCLMCSHDDEHAFGVIVNKPMPGVNLADIVADLDIACDDQAANVPVHFGGPVDMQRGVVLHSLDYRCDDTMMITPEIGMTASKAALKAICNAATKPQKSMLVMGHAGWGGHQLDEEVKRNDWLTTDARSDLVFGSSPDLWTHALKQLGITDAARLESQESPALRPN